MKRTYIFVDFISVNAYGSKFTLRLFSANLKKFNDNDINHRSRSNPEIELNFFVNFFFLLARVASKNTKPQVFFLT